MRMQKFVPIKVWPETRESFKRSARICGKSLAQYLADLSIVKPTPRRVAPK